jgi:hypothetical protein
MLQNNNAHLPVISIEMVVEIWKENGLTTSKEFAKLVDQVNQGNEDDDR